MGLLRQNKRAILTVNTTCHLSIWTATILFFHITGIFGQASPKDHFTAKDWFINNKDSAFYHSDTLRIIRIPKGSWSTKKVKVYVECEMSPSITSNYIELAFRKNKILLLCERINNSAFSVWGQETWKWLFDKNDNLLSIFYLDKLFASFYVGPERQVKIVSLVDRHPSPFNSPELTLIRAK